MKRLLLTLTLAAALACGLAGPALAWDQCTQYWVRDPYTGITRICDLCCRLRGTGQRPPRLPVVLLGACPDPCLASSSRSSLGEPARAPPLSPANAAGPMRRPARRPDLARSKQHAQKEDRMEPKPHEHRWELSQFPLEPCKCARYYCVECLVNEPETHVFGCPYGLEEDAC